VKNNIESAREICAIADYLGKPNKSPAIWLSPPAGVTPAAGGRHPAGQRENGNQTLDIRRAGDHGARI
jgi:hypothetical protein